MNEIERAILLIKQEGLKPASGYLPYSSNIVKAFSLAIQALEEKLEREENKPLTVKQLQRMTGTPVYMVSNTASVGKWGVIVGTFPLYDDKNHSIICMEREKFSTADTLFFERKPDEV